MSSNPNGMIERTPDGGIVRFDRSLAFPIDEVWAAITEPAPRRLVATVRRGYHR